jgi:hypothetical protein
MSADSPASNTTEPERPIPAEVEAAIRGVSSAERPEEAALTLAAIASRAIAELNKLARAQSNARRGQPDWGGWAGLANTARDAVLRVATCRKTAAELAQKARG